MKLSSAFIAACALLACVQAQATSQARFDITGLKYELVDLAPDDDIAPSFSYGDNYVPNFSNVTYVATSGFQWEPVYAHFGKGSYTPIPLPAPLLLPSDSDEIIWSSGHVTGTIGSDASGSFIHIDAFATGHNNYAADTGSDMWAILSPHTQLVMTAHASSSVSISGMCATPSTLACDSAGVRFYMDAGSWINDTYYSEGASHELFVSTSEVGMPAAATKSEDLEVRYANLTDQPMPIFFREYVTVGGYSQMAVPEPGQSSLTVLGLALMGMVFQLRLVREKRHSAGSKVCGSDNSMS